MPAFYTKRGDLTAYALACGYVETKSRGEKIARLWAEHGVFHVRTHDHGRGVRLVWEAFHKLGAARACYRAQLPPLAADLEMGV